MAVVKQFSRYVSLNILAMLGISCYILADTFFISVAEGADGLTALNLVLPVYSVIFAIGSMLGTGAATRFAILRAKGEKSADSYFANAVEFAVIFGAVFMIVGGMFPQQVVGLFGGDPHITEVGADYTRVFMLFAPFFMLNYICTAFVRNDGSPAIAMVATIASSLSNVLLDYVFMFPFGMGMTGAALATGISPLISIAVCCIHFFSKRNTVRFVFVMPSFRKLGSSCQLGASAFVGEISSGVTTTVFNFIILAIAGNAGVAAYGVVANFAIVGTAVFNGVAQGTQPLISRFYGEGDVDSLKKVLVLALSCAGVLAVIVISVVLIWAGQCVAFFNSENSVLLAEYAVPGIRLYFIGFLFAGFNIVGTGYLSAADKAVPAFVAAISRGFVAIVGLAFLLSALFGFTGVWLAFPAAELFTLVITVTGLVLCNKRMVKHEAD